VAKHNFPVEKRYKLRLCFFAGSLDKLALAVYMYQIWIDRFFLSFLLTQINMYAHMHVFWLRSGNLIFLWASLYNILIYYD